MRSLNKKILRDLWHMRGQVFAVGLVIAAGVAMLIMSLSTLEALQETTSAYYERYRFADVFANLKQAPDRLIKKISDIPGVRTVETRVIQYATLDIPDFNEPVMAQIVSVPKGGEPILNKLVIRQGRTIDADRQDQVIVNEPFAEAHQLYPGDEVVVILNGKRRRLVITGVALSPEFIYSLGPGSLMPDDLRFGVLWMNRDALAAAFNLHESFNSVSLELLRGVEPASVIQQLDQLLESYGGVGAIPRADQLSNWFIMNEIKQLGTLAFILPVIFLFVAAFLTNMVLARLITNERSYIGLMKAYGYSNFEVSWHYAKLVLGICVVGIVFGSILGTWFGQLNTKLYAEAFRFPLLIYHLSLKAFLIASGLSCAAALVGALTTIQRAAALPPAQAMQPPAPPVFRQSQFASTRAGQWLDQPTRIILRNLSRWPLRAALTSLGLASSIALLVMSLQWNDSINYLAESYFYNAQRQNVMVGMAQTRDNSVINEFRHFPGVLAAEPMRTVSADLSNGTFSHRGGITSISETTVLQPIYDDTLQKTITPPANGLILGSFLAKKLKVSVGDLVEVAVLEGRRPKVQIPVAGIFDTHLGMPAYLHIDALDRLLQEGKAVEFVNLLVDSHQQEALFNELKDIPAASSIMLRQAAIDSFYATLADHLMVFIAMFTALACILGFGVAYNSARISLSERGRELATLRVLGFRRSEISYILIGELGFLLVIALPLGCLLGVALVKIMEKSFNTELFRIPLVLYPSTFAWAMLISIVATLVSALIVRRRVDRLDLIRVLKTRE